MLVFQVLRHLSVVVEFPIIPVAVYGSECLSKQGFAVCFKPLSRFFAELVPDFEDEGTQGRVKVIGQFLSQIATPDYGPCSLVDVLHFEILGCQGQLRGRGQVFQGCHAGLVHPSQFGAIDQSHATQFAHLVVAIHAQIESLREAQVPDAFREYVR